ncbi:MAG: DUF58 domain-containing protein [Rhodospirillales bacterium]|nr:DUF58 domain-containing protein [Rhodospirillales bacterium]
MTNCPTPLVRALLTVAGWALLLGIALGRPELFALALPLLMALLQGAVRRQVEPGAIQLAADAETLFEGEDITLAVETSVAGARVGVQILPVLPPLLHPLEGPQSPELLALPGQPLAWRCRARSEAAAILHFDAVFVRAFDPFGLWVFEWGTRERLAITVLPQASAISRLPSPRHAGALFGAHASTRSGEGVAFADLRPFVTGDRLHEINWPVSLRRQSLHTNRFHTDRQANLVLLIDTFTMIGRRPNSSLDHILRAAAGFAAASLRRHDRVGLLEYGGIARSVSAGTGQGQYHRILHALARSTPLHTEFSQDLASLPEQVLSRRALVVALTPLADARFVRAVTSLAERGQDVVLLALATDELSEGLARRRDLGPLVRRLWRLEREERLRALRRAGVRAAHWPAARPLDATLGLVRDPRIRKNAA